MDSGKAFRRNGALTIPTAKPLAIYWTQTYLFYIFSFYFFDHTIFANNNGFT